MKAVILAAGYGTRMGEKAKGLIKIAGREIVYRTIKNLMKQGIGEFVIVTNERYKDAYEEFLKRYNIKGTVVVNPNPERGNGFSLHIAKDYVSGKFVLVMSDHVYEERFYEVAVKGEGLIADRRPRYVDVDEATKVKVEKDRIIEIGKGLKEWDALDTGFFILDDSIFDVTSKLAQEKEVVELKDVVKEVKLKVTFVDGLFWMDVDTPEDIKKARKLIVYTSVKGVGDGFISRHLNRKISTRISALLVEHVTPNQMTIVTFLFGIFSALMNFISVPIAGILYQVSSILDGVDGEIARARMQTSKFGGYFDSILDRYVDFTFLLILAYVSIREPLWWAIAAIAMFSSAMVSYSTERFKGAYCVDAYKVIPALRKVPGKRDERIFLTMLLTLVGWIKALFLILAIWSTFRVIVTVYLVKTRYAQDEG
ncbi:bifunctional L-myo-inositol-1-phosphate cytidylyltransferase/CDP-L-myo-inositol myo-inositolphosphotransferase [Pyrococcus abyssi]|uniref:Bifunctional IPC transferase and DIPP synthase n=1 Tax=Pyrococcus abyssi (strain GE5 / Orsay) TaxID=272844 RepID=Q9UZW1_PYRAB|nr:bifunctional L-myo-inositol-1-phosphate cytidylyltransferase/CDP-L-myo-inositol myo-inositolphosphotransferase [Pyrococcus abyssi]CAB49945.1 CDP-alcohol phosphatidyltransferase [Pyrococcus abyssi GE5]CCE70444.1 TPA: glucose-1-phosphate thymidylyltransferase related protein [Pyrococcus abyssi GE5]